MGSSKLDHTQKSMVMKPPPKKKSGDQGSPGASTTQNPLQKSGTPTQGSPLTPTKPASSPLKPSNPLPGSVAKSTAPAAPVKVIPSSEPRRAKPEMIAVGAGKVTLSAPKATSSAPPKQTSNDEVVPRATPSDKIEELVLALPAFRNTKSPPLLRDFYEKFLPRFRTPETTRALLEAFSNIDVNAERVGQILNANPYYEYHFLKVIASYGRKRDTLERLESALILMGMQNARNTVIALQAVRTAQGGHPQWDSDGKLKIKPNEVLKYALKTEEFLAGDKNAYADTAYAAGLTFDWMALVAEQLAAEKKKVLNYIENTYLHSLKTAQIGAEIAKSVPDLGFQKYVFSACLLHDIGKLAMAIVSPDYAYFLETVSKNGLTRFERQFAEQKRFGIDHAILGAIICEYLPTFSTISKAIQYHHEPYLLRGGKSGVGQLASLVCLATNIASNFKKPTGSDDPVFQFWRGPELKGFNIDSKTLIQVASRVV